MFLIFVSFCTAKDPSNMLAKADKLKHAEKYEEAEAIYDEILKTDPENKEALKGKDDCRIMLTPIIPMQHIAPDITDPDYAAAVKKYDEAKTPWDKKRAEIGIEHAAVRFTGKVFGKSSAEYKKDANKIVENAFKQIEEGQFAELVYADTIKKLTELQKKANQSWKGHGPDIYTPALNKLDHYLGFK
jgi:tetratricopeptide (TPR) repeat protein